MVPKIVILAGVLHLSKVPTGGHNYEDQMDWELCNLCLK